MRNYKTVEKLEKHNILDSVQCDICGKKATTLDWNSGSYQINETQIKIVVRKKEGESYPEGGYGTEYDIDICPDCFKNKLIPWFMSQGARIDEKDWDW